jgi:hypothetical protein
VFQHPRGENRGLQDRPGALVDDAQPTGLAVGQLHLVGGVDLPGLVRPLGSMLGLAAATAGGRGIQPGLGEGPLDCPLGRQGPAGVSLGQDDPDDPGAPTRMLASHRRGGLDQVGVALGRSRDATSEIIRGDPGGPGVPEAADQLPDRLGVQPQVGSDGVGSMPEGGPLEDDSSLRNGDGSTHLRPPRR